MRRLITVALIFAALAGACGKKGDPRAPELAAPEPIDNLTARQERDGISLSWSRPSRYIGGGEVKDLASFVIFRKDIPRTCPDCPVPYRPLTTVNVEDQQRFVKERRFRYIDEQVEPGNFYRYRVSSQLFDGSLSAPSNEVEIERAP
jgi:hypothetical protein